MNPRAKLKASIADSSKLEPGDAKIQALKGALPHLPAANQDDKANHHPMKVLALAGMALFPGGARAQGAPESRAAVEPETKVVGNELEPLSLPRVPRIVATISVAVATPRVPPPTSDGPHGVTKRTPFGLGWLGDSLAFGVAVAIDAMALMYTRARRVLSSESERRDEEGLRRKIGLLHVAAPMVPFTAGYLLSDGLLALGSWYGTAAVTGIYGAAGALMYAFANNILTEEAGLESKPTANRSFLGRIEGGVERFGTFLKERMPSAAWAMAMGVSVDAVISGLKFVQSSGWNFSEVALSCAIAGGVVYGLISGAQSFGARQIARLSERHALDTDMQVDRVATTLSRSTAAGFFAFRYFAWTGFLSAGLTATGLALNEWGVRAAALGLAVGQGWRAISGVWDGLKAAKRSDAEVFVGRRAVGEIEEG